MVQTRSKLEALSNSGDGAWQNNVACAVALKAIVASKNH